MSFEIYFMNVAKNVKHDVKITLLSKLASFFVRERQIWLASSPVVFFLKLCCYWSDGGLGVGVGGCLYQTTYSHLIHCYLCTHKGRMRSRGRECVIRSKPRILAANWVGWLSLITAVDCWRQRSKSNSIACVLSRGSHPPFLPLPADV